jgi:hypothetical protein
LRCCDTSSALSLLIIEAGLEEEACLHLDEMVNSPDLTLALLLPTLLVDVRTLSAVLLLAWFLCPALEGAGAVYPNPFASLLSAFDGPLPFLS